MFAALARLVLERRPWAAGLLLVLFGVCSLGGMRTTVDFSVEGFFSQEDVAAADAHQAFWGADDASLLVLVDGGEQSLLTRERLERIEAVAAELETDSIVDRVHSPTRAPRIEHPLPGVVLKRTLLLSLPYDPGRLAPWQDGILADPDLVPSLLSQDGRLALLKVELHVAGDDIAAVRPALDHVDGLLEKHRGQLGLSFTPAGIPAIRAGLLSVLVEDQLVFVPTALGLIALLMALLFRRPHGVLIPLAAALMPTLMLLGVLGWAGQPIGLINQTYLTLIPVIATADAIHMVHRYHEELRARVGEEHAEPAVRRQAITQAMQHVGLACTLTSLTTAIGFASLVLAEMPILRGFGLYAALGIGFAYLSVLVLVPLSLSFVSQASPRTGGPLRWLDRVLEVLAGVAVRRPWATLGVSGVVIAAALFFSLRVQVDNRATAILPPDHPTSQANFRIDQELGGLISVDVALQGEDLRSPEALAAMLRMGDRALELESVREVMGPAQLVASGSVMAGGARDIPPTQMGVDMVLEQADEARQMLLRGDRARLIIRSRDVGANAFKELTDQLQVLVDEELTAAGLDAQLSGSSVMAYAGLNRLTYDLRDSLMAAFVVIAVLITVLFRSLRTGLVSLLPNAAPLLVGYGLMGVMGWDLEPGPAVVFTVALGIAVDDSIHLLARFREERSRGKGRDQAILDAVQHAGSAVGVTSLLLGVGFAVNTLSAFPMNQVFGAVGAVIIATALLADVMLLPALLKLVEPADACRTAE